MALKESARPARPGRAGRRAGLALTVIAVSQLMVVLDATIVDVALPSMQRELGISTGALSWVVNAYVLAFGGFLLLGGRAGDLLGRRRVFLAGVGLFTVASLAGALAVSSGMLLAARALQGVGAAVIAPTVLALITTNFRQGSRRNRAFGVFSGMSSAGAIVGLLAGGVLTEWLSWRWVLAVNVPIGIGLAVLAVLSIKETPRRRGRFDLPGAILSALGMAALVHGLSNGHRDGWGAPETLAGFAAALVLLSVFVLVERRAEQPIVPLRMFADRNRCGVYFVAFALTGAFMGMFFFLTLFLQVVLGYSPLRAGLAFLPVMVCILVSARVTAQVLLARFGKKKPLVAGIALNTAALVWLAQLSADSTYLGGLLGPLVLFGIGNGLMFVPMTMIAVSGVEDHEAGSASSLFDAMTQIGGSAGLAVLVAVFGANGAHAGAGAAATLTEGIDTAFTAAAVLGAAALLVAVLFVRPVTPKQRFAPEILRLLAERQPERVPIVQDGGTFVSYAEWDRRSNAVAHGLMAKGVRKGDRVALFFEGVDWSGYAIAYFGVLKAGAAATHLNGTLSAAELERRLGHAEAVGVIHSADLAAPVLPAGSTARWLATVPELDGGDPTPVDVTITSEDIADILYTSGTTGPAKPLTNPHGNLSYGRGPGSVLQETFTSSAPILTPMPLGTVFSAGTVGIFALTTTAPILVCPADDVELMGDLVERYAVGSVMLTPWNAMRMVDTRVGDRYDLGSVTTIGIASAQLPGTYAEKLLEMMPEAEIMTAYGGGSEAVPASIGTEYDPKRPTRVGKPRPGTLLRLLDEAGRPVPRGEVGEVWLRTRAPKRLHLNPELNAATHVDGWTRTGDLAYYGPKKELYFFDRGNDVIRTSSGLVSSVQVENVLYDHPAVREAAAVAVPDDGHGQAVAAVVCVSGPDVDGELLRAFAAERLTPHQVPRVVHVVDELPRGPMGKVLKRELRDLFGSDTSALRPG
ncbi:MULTISPECIES: DHA2 family efflux MFS transporter permease subunit [Streptomyces]|uniref:DHA2 family efflux MFS transporter permease subunit n=1 Tax=Streptomyces TaxID=1883 RepID=UPI0018FEFC99|nr:DHA2 family efflux MFS transporter permease subunit [Streptomyces sp. CB02613]